MRYSITGPHFFIFGKDGNTLADGFLKFFEVNTDKPRTVFKDSELAHPHPETVRLNLNGYAKIYFPEGKLKMAVYDSDGVLDHVADPILDIHGNMAILEMAENAWREAQTISERFNNAIQTSTENVESRVNEFIANNETQIVDLKNRLSNIFLSLEQKGLADKSSDSYKEALELYSKMSGRVCKDDCYNDICRFLDRTNELFTNPYLDVTRRANPLPDYSVGPVRPIDWSDFGSYPVTAF